jgi:hippurate hydrolase
MDRWHEEMTAWRRDIHAHPELAFEEKRTAALVAEKLESFGLEVTRGVGETGVVGTLRCGSGRKTIAIRADMDALPMNEETNLPYASKHAGRMHACGHDGHTAILLGAAKRLAETKRFDGTVHFYFQPAEEKGGRGGAQAMVEDGLFDRFPTDAVFGLHNNVFLKEGEVGVRPGAAMSAADQFEIVVEGKGGHGARPQLALDPIVAASQLVLNLQTIVSRNVNPLDMAVISVTDNGAGIPADELPHVWSRLYRGDKSRSTRGLGLGLSLVKAIVEAHGGRVSVTSTAGTGSRFEVHLPVDK